LERRPHGANKDFTSRRILNWNTKELGTGKESNREDTRKHKEAIQQEKKDSQELKVGNHVWLENKNIQSNRLSKKLDNKRYGPFRIVKDIGFGGISATTSGRMDDSQCIQ